MDKLVRGYRFYSNSMERMEQTPFPETDLAKLYYACKERGIVCC